MSQTSIAAAATDPTPLDTLLDTASSQVRAFIEHTLRTAREHGVIFAFSADPQLPYPTSHEFKVSGYFIDRPRIELGVATGKPVSDWLPILVHESCHMDQWVEKATAWTEAFWDGRETVEYIDEWISGRDDLPLSIDELIRRSREVELDCERRAADKIRAFDLPIDAEDYTQRAISYVYFYNHMLKTRAWYESERAPYQLEEVWSAAPKQFTDEGDTPPALAAAFDAAYPAAPSKTPRSPAP